MNVDSLTCLWSQQVQPRFLFLAAAIIFLCVCFSLPAFVVSCSVTLIWFQRINKWQYQAFLFNVRRLYQSFLHLSLPIYWSLITCVSGSCLYKCWSSAVQRFSVHAHCGWMSCCASQLYSTAQTNSCNLFCLHRHVYYFVPNSCSHIYIHTHTHTAFCISLQRRLGILILNFRSV